MKIKSLFVIVFFGIGLYSCQDLNLEPVGQLDKNTLFKTDYGVQTYLATVYGKLPIEDFVYFADDRGYDQMGGNYWEAVKYRIQNASGEFVSTWMQIQNNGTRYWPYDRIRYINDFISTFPDYKENFREVTFNNYMGEAHFLRAYFYFGMVKRYGGVPIIKDVQYPQDDPEITRVSRATEYDAWKFIESDLDFAIANLSSNKNVFRANKYAAAALKVRCMLTAATNAKYDKWLNYPTAEAYVKGLAGIPESKANEFFESAYNAGKVVESGGYSLYMKTPGDLAENFANLFLDGDSPENIFVKAFDRYTAGNLRLRHTWDSGMLPFPDLSNFNGTQSYPALDVMRMFDFPDIVDAEGYPVRYEKRGDIREGVEPRARGSIWFNGDVLRGIEFQVQRGNYKTFTWKADVIIHGENSDVPNIITSGVPDPDPSRTGTINVSNRILSYDRYGTFDMDQWGIPRTATGGATGKYRYQLNHGTHEGNGGENNNLTGAFIRKYVDPTNTSTDNYGSSTNFIVFRLGEIYASMAEICYELGKETEAFDYIEKIRTRAGCKVVRPAIDKTPYIGKPDAPYNYFTYPYSIDASLQFIREERFRELWGEGIYWFDIRRWRVAEYDRSGYRPRALSCYYVIDEGKYIYLDERIKAGSTWTANRQCYYQGIDQAEINKNPNLLPQNPLR